MPIPYGVWQIHHTCILNYSTIYTPSLKAFRKTETVTKSQNLDSIFKILLKILFWRIHCHEYKVKVNNEHSQYLLRDLLTWSLSWHNSVLTYGKQGYIIIRFLLWMIGFIGCKSHARKNTSFSSHLIYLKSTQVLTYTLIQSPDTTHKI